MVLKEAAVRTFRERAIRSVVLIDDQFPKYGEAVNSDVIGPGSLYKDAPRAVSLHTGFHKRHIPCDVENDPSADNNGDGLGVPERIRKCDLVVLDFHLEDQNPEASIRLLRELSDSDHFNLVVIYTQANLDQVWNQVASNLRGGWKTAANIFEQIQNAATDDILAEWDDLNATGKIEVPTSLLRAHFGDVESDKNNGRRELATEIVARGGKRVGPFIEASIHEIGRLLHVAGPHDNVQRHITGHCGTDARWVLANNLFVAVVGKMPVVEDDTDEVGYLYQGLDAAIQDWNPNPFQIIASEAQNVLELDALPLDENALKDEILHAGMAWEALAASDRGEKYDEAADALLHRLGEALSARVRRRLDKELGGLSELLRSSIEALAGEHAPGPEARLARALLLAHSREPLDEVEVLTRLNQYLCTHPLDAKHLTAGSIFHDESNNYWLCVTPACDMVPGRIPAAGDRVHPGKTFVAMKLRKVDDASSVVVVQEGATRAVAEQGRHVFVRDGAENSVLVFSTVGEHSQQPQVDAFVAMREGLLSEENTFETLEIVVEGSGDESEAYKLSKRTCTVVGRLRDAYADRLLHQTGYHLSRIGVDFHGREQAT